MYAPAESPETEVLLRVRTIRGKWRRFGRRLRRDRVEREDSDDGSQAHRNLLGACRHGRPVQCIRCATAGRVEGLRSERRKREGHGDRRLCHIAG
jgi:hypothetical protein